MKTAIVFLFLIWPFLGLSQKQSASWSSVDRSFYSIKYPPGWTLDTSKALGADLFIFADKDSANDRFRENVNVMVQNLNGLDLNLDEYIAVSEEQIKTMLTNASILESRRVNETNKVYHKLVFTGAQGIFTLKTEQIYFVERERAFVITVTMELAQYGKYEETSRKILNSFKLKN